MSTVDPTAGNPFEAMGLTSSRTAQKQSEGLEDQFMTLMLTQMKNQDPLNPMENGDFLAQLAQFNTVNGIQDLQQSFSDFATSMQSNQALQASELVGRSVVVPSEVGVLPPDAPLEGQIMLPQSTGNLALHIYDASGQAVRRVELGAHGAGQVRFSWNGISDSGEQLPAGTYTIKATASINGQSEAVPTAVAAHVDSVTLGQGGSGSYLNLAGLGTISLSDVQQIM